MAISPEQFDQLATKEDLKDLVTKDYLDKRIGLDIKGLEENLKEKLSSKEDMSKVLNAVDGLAKQFDVIETEFKSDKIAHARIQEDVDNIKEHLELKTTL